MADYPTARAAIATIIDAVSIASPVVASLTVYETKPDAEAQMNYPHVALMGYTSRYLRRPGGGRERIYTTLFRLAVHSIAGATRRAQLEALKEAIGVAFDAKITLGLGGGYSVVEGPNWILPEPEVDGATVWDDGAIIVAIKDSATFAA